MNREFYVAGEICEICRVLTVPADKIIGSDDFFNKYEQFGTYFGKQVLRQLQMIFYKILALYAPFVMINSCYY